jgi:ribonucleoside-triphosphate reductase
MSNSETSNTIIKILGGNEMRSVAEIDRDIANVKAEMQDVHGTTTEVYARIVGYYRSVRNWNPGKREEYKHRKLFVAEEQQVHAHLPVGTSCCAIDPVTATSDSLGGTAARYELFIRKTCPNCPPVKECCTNLPLSGSQIDVDSPEGFARASDSGVFSAPTVIFFDAADHEIARAHTVSEIRSLDAIGQTAEAAPALF